MLRNLLILSMILAAPAALVWAQAPDLDGPDGSNLTRTTERVLDEYELPVGPFGQEAPTVKLTGAVTRRAWRLPAEAQTVVSVMRDYRRQLRQEGFRRLLDCSGTGCGGFDFRFGADLLPPPDMAIDVRDFQQLSVGREDPAVYVSVLVSRVRDWIYVQIVSVVPEDAELVLAAAPLDKRVKTAPEPDKRPDTGRDAGAADSDTNEDLDTSLGAGALAPPPMPPDAGASLADGDALIGNGRTGDPADEDETRPAEATLVAPTTPGSEGEIAEDPEPPVEMAARDRDDDASEAPATPPAATPDPDEPADPAMRPDPDAPLLENLKKHGHVAVRGLVFESSGVGLTTGSAPALDDMARMLIENQDLRVAIVGHSDNVGPLRVNIDISRRRAETVRQALIERGVNADRLEAQGIGYLAPRRSNATPEGRAMNRRVELVVRENRE